MLAAWLDAHGRALWWVACAGCAVPGLWLALCTAGQVLGPNPLESLLHVTGETARTLLLVALSITPLRDAAGWLSRRVRSRHGKRLSDWNWLVRMRRMFGLWCFAYAFAHAALFFEFDLGRDLSVAWAELVAKPYLMVGAIALVGLLPLAVTSTRSMMVLLGRHWALLHRLVHPVSLLVLAHEWMTMKAGSWDAVPATLVLCILLGHRLLVSAGRIRAAGHDGVEVPERLPGDRSGQELRAPGTR